MSQFDYEDGFRYLCGGLVAILIGGIYCDGLRVGGIVHLVHLPHDFSQFVYLFLFKRSNRGAELIP